MAASSQSKYSIGGITRNNYKDIFFQHGSFSDQKTVAYSLLEIDEEEVNSFQTMSGDGEHAEGAFIKEANEELKHQNIEDKNLHVIIMLSKSPCFNCREELEVFFEKIKKEKQI